jgi:hypothetical protein
LYYRSTVSILSLTQIFQLVIMSSIREYKYNGAGHTVPLSSTTELLNYSHCFAHRVIKNVVIFFTCCCLFCCVTRWVVLWVLSENVPCWSLDLWTAVSGVMGDVLCKFSRLYIPVRWNIMRR